MRIFAFQGTRFSSQNGEPGRHAAPPYDQINSELRDRLHAEDEWSFARLTRPLPPAGRDPLAHAAELQRSWLESGVLERDEEPCLYPYRIDLAGGASRLGLFAMVGLEEPTSGVIRAHEQTISKTVAERLELLRALRADLGPVLLLSEDRGELDRHLSEDAAGSPIATWTDADGHRHHLYRLTDRARIDSYRRLLEEAPGLIADGHHRNQVGRLYADETGAAPGSAAAAKLSVITSLESDSLAIDPIHRALPFDVSRKGAGGAVLETETLDPAVGGSALAAAVARSRQPALGVLTRDAARLWVLDPAQGPEDLPAAASELAVVMLHHALFPRWNVPQAAGTDGTIPYRSDPDELFDLVRSGGARSGVLLPPMTPAGFAAAIAEGHLLPPKSTRFLPKVASGLVWTGHDARLE